MRAPVTSVKHYVQRSLNETMAGAATAVTLASVVDQPNAAAEVHAGSVIKAVFIEMWARANDIAAGSVLLTLVKCPDGQTPNFADIANLDDYNNKKNVLYHTQGLSNDKLGSAIPFIRQWFKIPKGKQRFGLNTSLNIAIRNNNATAIDLNVCGVFIYKEYT